MGNINPKDPDFWASSDDPGVDNSDWMSKISDGTNIAELSIPGTHNTMATTGVIWATCQSLSLDLQLKLGIRYLDIRCRHFNNCLPIHHGQVYMHCSFTDVLKSLKQFLNFHPRETVLMRVKEEDWKPEGNSRTFKETVAACLYPNYLFWLKNDVPSLGEVRGKIVILDDFSYGQGINYRHLDIEDHWNESDLHNKLKLIRAHLTSARSKSSTDLYLTYSSCQAGVDSPKENARRINPELHSYIRNNGGRLGIIAMDYPGPKIVQDIINHN